MKTELLRKVASLCRDRNALDRSLSNITGANDLSGLIEWIAREALGLTADETGQLYFGRDAFSGKPVQVLWLLNGQNVTATEDGRPVLAFIEDCEQSSATKLLPHFIDRIVLVDGDRTTPVFPVNECPELPLSDEQVEAIARFSTASRPALSRYN